MLDIQLALVGEDAWTDRAERNNYVANKGHLRLAGAHLPDGNIIVTFRIDLPKELGDLCVMCNVPIAQLEWATKSLREHYAPQPSPITAQSEQQPAVGPTLKAVEDVSPDQER